MSPAFAPAKAGVRFRLPQNTEMKISPTGSLEELGVTYALHLSRWKARGPLSVAIDFIELFSLALTVERYK